MELGSLSPEQHEWQIRAKAFADEYLTEASVELDNQVDPQACFPGDLIVHASSLGLRTLKIPKEFGGGGADCLTEVVVQEELCVGDVGFGMTLQHAWREGNAIASLGSTEQRDRYLPTFIEDSSYLTSYALTESHFGSDAGGASEDPSDGPRTKALRTSSGWSLIGRKMWVTNASLARLVLVLCRTDPAVPWRDGVTWFIVDTTNPGYGVGRVEDKLGIRLNQNAEIILDNCLVDEGDLLGELNAAPKMSARMAAGSRVKTAAKCLGVARACWEESLAHARSTGSINRHQGIRSMLVEMETELESTRSLILRAAMAVDRMSNSASRLETLAKMQASVSAARVADLARQVHGPYASIRGNRIEKLLRDAACLQHLGGGVHAGRAHLGEADTI